MNFLRATFVLCCAVASSTQAIMLDFEEYSTGDVLSDLGYGVTLSARKKENGSWKKGQAMIFDSSKPSGDDWDLGTPNEKFGGPGRGVAGESGLFKNDKPLGNVVIVSEDEDASDPDDNIGGILMFDFASPMRLGDVGLLDNEEGTIFTVTLVDGNTKTLTMGTGGDNSAEVVTFADKGLKGVIQLKIKMEGSGAISFVEVTPMNTVTTPPPTKAPVPTINSGVCSEDLIKTNFVEGSSGFVYADDVFRDTSSPGYSHGAYKQGGGENKDGALVVTVGGKDTAHINKISGGFSKSFELEMETDVKLRFKFYLHMEEEYEDDEVAEVLVSVDDTLYGINGNTFVAQKHGGGVIAYKYADVNFGSLPSGSHTLTVGLYNNKKTYVDEVTTLVVDELNLTQTCRLKTKAPSNSPTSAPSSAPTKSPTTAPTKAPTTARPTNAPTKGPTTAPSKAPINSYQLRTGSKISTPPTSIPTSPPTENCIATNWKADGNGEELICSTKKVFVETASTAVPVTCAAGHNVKVSVDAVIHFPETATTPFYDVAWYVATDGGDALEGTCQLTPLGEDTFSGATLLSSNGGEQIGSIVWDTNSNGDGDQCGDVVVSAQGNESGANLNIPLAKELELPCLDENLDGQLDFAVCFTWRLDCNNDVCSFDAVIPGNPTTGCYCTRVDVTNTQVEDPNPIQPC